MDTYTDALTALNENLANTEESFDETRRAAISGDAEAQYNLGCIYYSYAWYDEVSAEAVKWLERAAEQGHIQAQFSLGHGSTSDLERDLPPLRNAPEEARKWLLRAAEGGNSDAISCVIEMYQEGLVGAQKDLNEAAKWQLLYDSKWPVDDDVDLIRRKAEAGDFSSQRKLAGWFAHGHALVEANDEEAIKWHSFAAEHQDENEPTTYYSQKEIGLFNRLAGHCGIKLQRCLGKMYKLGKYVEQSDDGAVRWYELAAGRGDVIAQYELATIYHYGEEATLNNESAAKWYMRAAEQGHCESQYQLASMYDNGKGVPQSDELAAKWYERAAKQGHGGAQNNLGTMYDSGRGVKQNYRTAMKWFRRAAKQGEMVGQYRMGLMYLYGHGVKTNDQKAAQWFRQSSESGCVWGAVAVGTITGKVGDLVNAVEKLFDAHLDASLGKIEDCSYQLEDFNARLKTLIEVSHVSRGQQVWKEYEDGNDVRCHVKVLSIEARLATTLRGMLALLREEPDEKEAGNCFEWALKNEDTLAAYYLSEIANRNSDYARALKYLDLVSNEAGIVPAYKREFGNKIKSLSDASRGKIRIDYEKEKTHKETLSFLTHTLNNALSTGPETVRTVIDILGSDLYDQGQAEYKAINNMASLFPMFLFAESLLKTFKLYVSDPEQIREKWKSDKVGDANISLVIAMALRQSVARLVFSSNHLTQLKRLLPSQDKDSIKNIRKSFVDEIIPLEISVATASKVFDWVNAHFSALRIEIAPDAEMAFTSNATRYMFFFAAFSELIYNALKYSDGREPIVVKWFRQGDDYCLSCVNSCQLALANLPSQEGSNKGLLFIEKLMSMLEGSRLNSQLENGEYQAMLQFGHDNFGENIA